MNKLNEAAGPLRGLPKHWITYLTARNGKTYGIDMAGEKSPVKELSELSVKGIKTALKDKEMLAIIGRKDGAPVFMIAPHGGMTTKFRIFETEPGRGNYDSKGSTYWSGRRSRRTEDYYTAEQILDIVKDMLKDASLSGISVEVIGKDKAREEVFKQRRATNNVEDPLYTKPDQWGQAPVTAAKSKRAKKYTSLKKSKLDTKVDFEKQKLKTQIINALDEALDKAIMDMKNGYSWHMNADELSKDIMKNVNLRSIQALASQYSAVSGYGSDDPYAVYKKLKEVTPRTKK